MGPSRGPGAFLANAKEWSPGDPGLVPLYPRKRLSVHLHHLAYGPTSGTRVGLVMWPWTQGAPSCLRDTAATGPCTNPSSISQEPWTVGRVTATYTPGWGRGRVQARLEPVLRATTRPSTAGHGSMQGRVG